jgi:hypothetical protein
MAIATGTAILGSAVLGAASSRSAGKAQERAAGQAADLQREQFERQMELQAPFREAGLRALNKLEAASEYTPFGMEQFQADPGYAFRFAQGQKALERSAAARGGLISGNTGGALQQFGQGLASQEYQNAFNRYQAERSARLNPLQSLAGVGQTSVNQLGAAGQNYAMGMGEALGAGAQARASGYMGAANAIGGGVGQYMNYQQNQATNSLLNQVLRDRNTGVGYGGGGGGGSVGYQNPYGRFEIGTST